MRQGTPRHDIKTWSGGGAVFGLVGGILAALLGSLLTAAAWVVGGEIQTWLHAFAASLLLSTIPLLALGAYCLDALEARTKRHAAGGHRVKTVAPSSDPAPVLSLARA